MQKNFIHCIYQGERWCKRMPIINMVNLYFRLNSWAEKKWGIYMNKNSVASSKKIIRKLVLLCPVVIFLTGAIIYYVFMPDIYSKKILFFDWLFSDSQGIINKISYINDLPPESNNIIGIQIFWRIWLAGFSASLFFACKQLHTKSVPISKDAILVNREPYLLIQGTSTRLNQIQPQRRIKELDVLIYTIKCLEEKLSVESDFGYGNYDVIDCENNITRQLQFLKDAAKDIETGNIAENIKVINSTVLEVNTLLQKRTELKKHSL